MTPRCHPSIHHERPATSWEIVLPIGKGVRAAKGGQSPLGRHIGTPATAGAKCLEQLRDFTCRAVRGGPELLQRDVLTRVPCV